MNTEHYKQLWLEEEGFSFQGWDFSHLDGRWQCEPLPWDYRAILERYLRPGDRLLDMGTGGGEFLLTLGRPYALTTVTEAYPPNVELCRNRLEPLGITVAQTFEDELLPFGEDSFDIIINRHESFDASEVFRVLKPGGYFITQQVGGQNDHEFSERLIPNFQPQFPKLTLENTTRLFRQTGFSVLSGEEAFTTIRFFDTGALAYFAKICPWEFPGFTVEAAFDRLCGCQAELEQKGCLLGTEHRFIIASQKPRQPV